MVEVIIEKVAFTQYVDGIAFNGKAVAAAFDVPPPIFQGTVSGYTSGGYGPSTNIIDKFSFTTDANATDVGDLSIGRRAGLAGQSSAVNGYSSGGMSPVNGTIYNTIDKFPFATDGNATDVGDLTQTRKQVAGQSSINQGYGYTSGGYSAPLTKTNVIDKFPFGTDANATDVGDLTAARFGGAGQSSSEDGYTSAGNGNDNYDVNIIDKFPFATDANATDVGDLTSTLRQGAGQSSSTHGYITSGNQSRIDKFSFASAGNATTIGYVLPNGGQFSAVGQSSVTNGYNTGGASVSTLDILKFSFAVDANATEVGDLTVSGRNAGAGQQV